MVSESKRIEGIKLGDRYTKYFHDSARKRMRRNMIDVIQDDKGEWATDSSEITNCFTTHFQRMATAYNIIKDLHIINLIPSYITPPSPAENEHLLNQPDAMKIKNILFSMEGDKAPDHEIIHHMNTIYGKKGNKGIVGLKIDMAKAFDRVDWSFLMEVMKQKGRTSDKRCNLIQQCISTTNLVVLVNGAPRKKFKPSRGLKQRDPLSPYLFLFYREALSRSMVHAEQLGLFHGIQICPKAPPISHLLFAEIAWSSIKMNLIITKSSGCLQQFQEIYWPNDQVSSSAEILSQI
ncbi:uncharacterized protein LOC113291381 [Papaver somniferum]|uniref:uncharacterized protein LOC113291381 n=1 Tax=Papaver somniferum TaxID=3469 RepID=UPI000E70151B|nr:uncharacterized protein LOC113291381 [Papaver somniferum]